MQTRVVEDGNRGSQSISPDIYMFPAFLGEYRDADHDSSTEGLRWLMPEPELIAYHRLTLLIDPEVRLMKRLAAALFFAGSLLAPAAVSAAIITLVELDFQRAGSGPGTGSVPTIPSSDSQFEEVHPAVTFDQDASAFTPIGGTAGSAGWSYNGFSELVSAAVNNDLHGSVTFGSPTRFDIDLGTAAPGTSYTITGVEITVRASNKAGSEWAFGYRKSSDSSVEIIDGGLITTQPGTVPPATYAIDLTAENLVATDSSVPWNTGGTGELRFFFAEPAPGNTPPNSNDNLQIDSIRILGTVIPEPATALLACLPVLFGMCGNRTLG